MCAAVEATNARRAAREKPRCEKRTAIQKLTTGCFFFSAFFLAAGVLTAFLAPPLRTLCAPNRGPSSAIQSCFEKALRDEGAEGDGKTVSSSDAERLTAMLFDRTVLHLEEPCKHCSLWRPATTLAFHCVAKKPACLDFAPCACLR